MAKHIAKATSKEIEYTLKKGFDEAECREWIVKTLKDHKVLSRKQINELLCVASGGVLDDLRRKITRGYAGIYVRLREYLDEFRRNLDGEIKSSLLRWRAF